MNKIETMIAIDKEIATINESGEFKIYLSFAKNNDWELKVNETPDAMCVLIQHEDWRDNDMYYETYYDFETLREEMTEGESLNVDIDLENFKETCHKWINNAKKELTK